MESEFAREVLELNKELAVQLHAQNHILLVLLRVISDIELQKIKTILQSLAEDAEPQGLAGDSLRLAAQIVSLVTDGDTPPDPRNMMRILTGGKKNL